VTTYEQGRAPEGAPVTWRNVVHEGCEIVLDSGAILRELHASDADAICRAFHLASLAEEYAAAGDESDKTASPGYSVFATIRWRRAASALRDVASDR